MKITDIKVSKRDYQQLTYNCYSDDINGKSVTDKFPALKRAWKGYKMSLEIERFIILFFDINSPLEKMYTDWVERKKVAALLAGFKVDETTGYFDEEHNDILNGKNEKVNNNIFEFIKLFRSSELEHLITLKQNYYQIRQRLNNTTTSKKHDSEVAKIEADALLKLNEIHSMIRIAEKEFLKDQTSGLRKDLFRIIEDATTQLPISSERRLPRKGGDE